jgi:hypothetical protein
MGEIRNQENISLREEQEKRKLGNPRLRRDNNSCYRN